MDTSTGRDEPRPAATGDDTDFSLSIEEAAERYDKAGHPRTIRTLQRYCASGHLECCKDETPFGDKYRITPQSVARHIAQIVELRSGDIVAVSRDEPRPAATTVAQQQSPKSEPTPPDQPRQATTAAGGSPHDVVRLEREVERLSDDRDFLREQMKVKDGQLAVKDQQIAAMLERDRETNILIRGLQEGLLLSPGRQRPTEDSGPRMDESRSSPTSPGM